MDASHIKFAHQVCPEDQPIDCVEKGQALRID